VILDVILSGVRVCIGFDYKGFLCSILHEQRFGKQLKLSPELSQLLTVKKNVFITVVRNLLRMQTKLPVSQGVCRLKLHNLCAVEKHFMIDNDEMVLWY